MKLKMNCILAVGILSGTALAEIIGNEYLGIEFDSAGNGFGDKSIVNRLAGDARFVNPGGDLRGAVRFEISEKGMAFVTADYVERVPPPIKDVKVADGCLTWTPADDPDHCYYRVYENGSQIASTVATSLPAKTNDVSSFTVKNVDKWGNEGR